MRILTTVLSALALLGCSPNNKLHIYTWSDYIDPELIEEFEKRHNCEIVIDTFDSNENMYAKMKAGATGYDVVIPSSYILPTMIREGMLAKLDHARLPNVKKNFDDSFNDQLLDSSLDYSIPYALSYCGVCYRNDKESVMSCTNLNSWSVFENKNLAGKMALLNDNREVIGAALMYLGYSCNTEANKEIDEAVELAVKWKKNIRKFDSESYRSEMPEGSTWIAMGYACDVIQLILGDLENDVLERRDISFTLPDEGFTITCDEMVVPVMSPNQELAYEFIDFMYDPDVALRNIGYICAIIPVKKAVEDLDDDLKSLLVVPPEKLKRGQLIKNFDDKPKLFEMYNKAWDEIMKVNSNNE